MERRFYQDKEALGFPAVNLMKILRTSSVSLSVRPSFFILSFLFSIFVGASISTAFLIVGILFLVFFIHELGHVAVSWMLGRPCETVIGGAGGKTEVFGPLLKFWQRTAILLGGVLATYFVMAGARVWLFDEEALSTTLRESLYLLYSLSVGWFWFNLLPLYPFDGGEIALDIGRSLFGRFGERAVAILSMLIALFLTLYLLAAGAFVGVILCFYCLTQSFTLFRHPSVSRVGDLSEDAVHLHELRQRWLVGEQDDIIAQMQKLAHKSDEKEVRQEAVECCSGYLLATERPREAYDMLLEAQDSLMQPALEHLQLAAYRTSHWFEGLEAGREAFRECHSLPVATLCAMLAARMGLAEESVSWLQTSKMLGLDTIANIVGSVDFDSIRANAEFQAFEHHWNFVQTQEK
jgi:Zn-dependent protease